LFLKSRWVKIIINAKLWAAIWTARYIEMVIYIPSLEDKQYERLAFKTISQTIIN
jgi:hypothetical protein